MTLYSLKPGFQALLRPAVRLLHDGGVTANQVTIATAAASLLLGGGLALAAADGVLAWFLLLPGWLLLRMALNAIDGLLARELGQASRLGAYLNELADLLADAALYLPFALLTATTGALAVIVVVLANVAEMAAVLATGNGNGRRNEGPMGKSDRALVFGALGLLLGCGVAPGPWLAWVLTIVAILLLLTISNRVRQGISADQSSNRVPHGIAADQSSLGQCRRATRGHDMRQAMEKQFRTHDGSSLFYRHWPSQQESGEACAIILLHRGHEHSGRVQHVVDELGLDPFALFAWDARGHGRSPGARGDSPSFAALVRDLDAFVAHIVATYGIAVQNIALIGQSVGAVIAATWVHDYAPRLRCLVLTAPAFQVRLYVPLARPGLNLIRRLFGNFFITSYVKARFLTQDPQRIASYDADPLITRHISARVLLELADAADRVVADAQAIRMPLQLLISGKDWVVHRQPQERFFEHLGSPVRECHLLPGFLHDTLGERERGLALAAIRAFIERMFAAPPAADSLLQADRSGYTRDEELRLSQPLPLRSLRRLSFAGTRLAMRTLGRLSEGITIGLRTGFDSGSSLDHVYRNQARGRLLLGRLIDRGYLDSIGWRGIRIRRSHLLKAIADAAERLRATGQPLRIFDPASGHGRYLVEAVQTLPERPQSLLLRDLDAANIVQAQALLDAAGLADIARCETGDAFAETELTAFSPRPNLVTVSGLYELFSDNQLIACSLRGLAQAIEPGGYLIYTGQPWHPQLELIARTLTSHRGHKPWIMRRRTQAEIDELVRVAGFSKLTQWIDDWGMFSVSLARRD